MNAASAASSENRQACRSRSVPSPNHQNVNAAPATAKTNTNRSPAMAWPATVQSSWPVNAATSPPSQANMAPHTRQRGASGFPRRGRSASASPDMPRAVPGCCPRSPPIGHVCAWSSPPLVRGAMAGFHHAVNVGCLRRMPEPRQAWRCTALRLQSPQRPRGGSSGAPAKGRRIRVKRAVAVTPPPPTGGQDDQQRKKPE